MSDCSILVEKVVEGDWKEIARLTQEEIDSGTKPEEIILKLQAGMELVGEKYSTGEYFLPDMMKSARCMSLAFEVLKPVVESSSFGSLGKIVIGTVKSDMHDIGKNIVTGFLRGVGFDVIDLGADVSEDRFVEEVIRHQPDILGLSSLLTTTMRQIGVVIKKLEESGFRSSVKVIAGGAPITEKFAMSMGADAYAADGGQAVKVCKQLVQRS
ncbi:MAG: corrinoid protein [Syntrophaceae bacterium]|nr:corrinoid protein [Syntrophaceae bacterium]